MCLWGVPGEAVTVTNISDMFWDFSVADILVLHASSVFNEDGALVFLGPSGIGKTTMRDLLSPYMNVLAEDKVYLVPQVNGNWHVIKGDSCPLRGIRLSSVKELTKLPYAPLRAAFRLYQAENSTLQKLDPLSLCRNLTDAFFEIAWQRDTTLTTKQRAFANLAEIARLFPGYEFHVKLSPRTLNLLNLELDLHKHNSGQFIV